MPLQIPLNYPNDCTPDQIRSTIVDIQSELETTGFQINDVLRFSPLINLGQSELERRQNAAVVKQSKILGFISIGVAVVALAVAGLGAASSAKWEAEQIGLLTTISGNTNIAERLSSQTALLEKIEARVSSEITCVLDSSEIEVADDQEKTD